MKGIAKVLFKIGSDPTLFWLGWLSAVIGFILGFVIIGPMIYSAWR